MIIFLTKFFLLTLRSFGFSLSNHFFLSSIHCSVNELYVDDPDKDSGGKIEVSLNISLPNLHCDCEYIHNIYIYTTLSSFALRFLFVCFPFFATGLLFISLFPSYQTLLYPIIRRGILAKDK